jgi:hypothetical protein
LTAEISQEEESLRESSILKTDSRQRVWVSRERREAILEEFDKSGASAMRFAAYAGIKYSTFANWVARRKQAKAGTAGEHRASEPSSLTDGITELRSFTLTGRAYAGNKLTESDGILGHST